VAKPEKSVESANQENTILLVLAWLFVGIPLAWGVADTIRNATKLFS
jgi:hypothetical protein